MSTEKTEKKRKFIIDVLYLVLILAIGYVLIRFALPLLMPFVIAFVIAYLLRRPIRFLSRVLHLPKSLVAVLMVLVTYGIIGLAVTLLGVRITATIGSLVDQIPSLYSQYLLPTLREISFWLEELLSGADPQVLTALEEMQTQLFSMLGQLVSSVSVWLTTWVSSTAVSVPGMFIRLLLMVISTFFFTIDYEKITQFVLNALHGHTREIVLQVKNYVVGTLFVCIWSYALIMFITFTELSIGLWVIGVERSTLIAVSMDTSGSDLKNDASLSSTTFPKIVTLTSWSPISYLGSGNPRWIWQRNIFLTPPPATSTSPMFLMTSARRGLR